MGWVIDVVDEDEFYEGLAELAEGHRKLVEGEEKDPRDERGRSVDLQFLREMIYSLESVSIGTHQLLYFSAMRYSRQYLDCEASDLSEATEELDRGFDSMNLGSLYFHEGDPSEIELEENAFTHNAPDSGRKMCYFIAGYIAGFLENCLGNKYVVNEVRCSAEGADSCAFEVRER